jgi:prophage DNA circulation protein
MSNVDVLSQLLEASWRGIPFPTLGVESSFAHNIVAHKRVDRNGKRVENTGFDGGSFTVRIPFINSLAKGPSETWRDLYPDTYRKVLAALEDRSTGDFIHPDYGLRRCKVATFGATLDPDYRGGPIVNVALIETVDDGDAVALGETSVIPIAAAAAVTLDAKLGALYPSPYPKLTDKGQSLGEFVKAIGAIGDQVDLAAQQIEGKINRVIAGVDKLKTEFSSDGPFADAADRLISSLHAYKRLALVLAKGTKVHITAKATTCAVLSVRLRNKASDLLALNPALAKALVVPAQTLVRYYA